MALRADLALAGEICFTHIVHGSTRISEDEIPTPPFLMAPDELAAGDLEISGKVDVVSRIFFLTVAHFSENTLLATTPGYFYAP